MAIGIDFAVFIQWLLFRSLTLLQGILLICVFDIHVVKIVSARFRKFSNIYLIC